MRYRRAFCVMLELSSQPTPPKAALQILNGAEMQSQIDVTDEGIVVVRTSINPDVVAALHTHAAEISDMADRGMQAVHEAMMQRAGN